MLPGMLEIIAEKQSLGWDMAFVDASKDCRQSVDYVGFGVWFGEHDDRNECSPVPVGER